MRIYKGSEITLKLYTRINCQSIEADKMRVVLFTTNPNNSCIVNNIVVSGNTLLVTIGRNDLNVMEDGVINYIILGYDDNEEIYNSTRQSNYYLKTPDGYVAKSIQTSKDVYIVDNGDYKILPDEDYSSIEEVNVHVEFDAEPYIQRGIELGEEIQKSKLESVSITENGIYTREDGYNEIHVEVPDLNGDFQTGYDEGIEVGKAEQKALLEPITITENGTYSREDGYNEVIVDVPDLNGSYDEGYTDGYAEGEANGVEKAGSIIAETARVLDITENGYYMSRYSEPPTPDVTGVYPDGTQFYNYAQLEKFIYYSGFLVSKDMEIEIWWKGDVSKTYGTIIGSEIAAGSNFKIGIPENPNQLEAEIVTTPVTFSNAISNKWYHLRISYANGFWVDGEKIGDFPGNIFGNPYNLYINSGNHNNFNGANGYFGMIKITTNGVENIIIPTEDGLKNITTDEMLEVSYNNGVYAFTDNTPQVPEGNLIKTINVNITQKINVWDNAIKFGESKFDYIPQGFDFSGKPTSLEGLFRNCNNLLELPYIDTSEVTNYSEWLLYTFKITNIPFEIILNENANCIKMFYNSSLKEIPFFVTSNVTTIHYMFGNAKNIKTLPPFDFSKVTNYQYWIEGCTNLESLPYYDFTNVTTNNQYLVGFGGNLTNLTEIGGFALKQSCNGTYGLVKMPNLSYQSCINQLNALYDFTGNGETPTSSQGQLKVHQNFLNLVGEEISIGTNKGWTITA